MPTSSGPCGFVGNLGNWSFWRQNKVDDFGGMNRHAFGNIQDY